MMRIPTLISVLLLALLDGVTASNSTCVVANADYPHSECVARCLDNSDASGGLCYYDLDLFCSWSGAFDCEPTPVKCYFEKWGDCLDRECTNPVYRYEFVQAFKLACKNAGNPITSIAGEWGTYLTAIPGQSTSTASSSIVTITPTGTEKSLFFTSVASRATESSSITQAPASTTNSSVSTPNTTTTAEKSSLSTAAIAGIVVGVVVFLALLIGAIFLFMRRRKRESSSSTKEEPSTSDSSVTGKAELNGADYKVELHEEGLKAELPGQNQHQAELHGETAVWELDASKPDGAKLHGEPVIAELDAGPRTPPNGDVRDTRGL